MRLHLPIDPASLKTLYASNEKLTLVKQTDPSQAEVAWVAFAPFENHTVTWSEPYAVYAAPTEWTAAARNVGVLPPCTCVRLIARSMQEAARR